MYRRKSKIFGLDILNSESSKSDEQKKTMLEKFKDAEDEIETCLLSLEESKIVLDKSSDKIEERIKLHSLLADAYLETDDIDLFGKEMNIAIDLSKDCGKTKSFEVIKLCEKMAEAYTLFKKPELAIDSLRKAENIIQISPQSDESAKTKKRILSKIDSIRKNDKENKPLKRKKSTSGEEKINRPTVKKIQ
ncbi:hypothetical protein MHBO_000149 [Bonamia ostreae]